MLTRSQRQSWTRHGDREIQRTIDAAKAELAADAAAERQAARVARTPAPTLTAADVQGARFIRTAVGWHRVVRVNAKSVTVETEYSWTDRYPLSAILEARH